MMLHVLRLSLLMTALVAGTLMALMYSPDPVSGYEYQEIPVSPVLIDPSAAQYKNLDKLSPARQHSTPCSLECQQPFLHISLHRAAAPTAKSHFMLRTALTSIPDPAGRSSRARQALMRSTGYIPSGPPYREHRAITGRQIT